MLHVSWPGCGAECKYWKASLENVRDSGRALTSQKNTVKQGILGAIRRGCLEFTDHRSQAARGLFRDWEQLHDARGENDRRDPGGGHG